jgi:hypothetical protein
MKYWFYVLDGQQAGPVDENAFQQLVLSGTIVAETLVWSDGMADWCTYGELAARSTAGLPLPPTGSPVPPTSTSIPAPLSSSFPSSSLAGASSTSPSPMALSGLVLGVVSMTFGFCCCSGWPFSIPGIIVSGIALSQSGGVKGPSRQYAAIGLALSILSLLLSVIFLLLGTMPHFMGRRFLHM